MILINIRIIQERLQDTLILYHEYYSCNNFLTFPLLFQSICLVIGLKQMLYELQLKIKMKKEYKSVFNDFRKLWPTRNSEKLFRKKSSPGRSRSITPRKRKRTSSQTNGIIFQSGKTVAKERRNMTSTRKRKKSISSKRIKRNKHGKRMKCSTKGQDVGVADYFSNPCKASPFSKSRFKNQVTWQVTKRGDISANKQSFLSYLYGTNYIEVEEAFKKDMKDIPTEFEQNGCKLTLFGVKDKKDNSSMFPSNKLSLYYIITSGGDYKQKFDVKTELEKWGDCASVNTRKMMSRLELCISNCDRCRLSVNDFSADDFEIIEDNYHDECGFIPSKYFNKLQIQPGKSALQIRLFCGDIGWAKGMLLRVNDNIDKIQITRDMIKVPASTREDRHKHVVMVISNTYPSTNCKELNKVMDPNDTFVSKKGRYEKQKYNKIINVKDTMVAIWKQFKVSQESIKHYHEDTKHSIDNVKHASVMGVVDPTGELPEGHIFITGNISNGNGTRVQFGHSGKKIFVARYPCLVERDTAMWPMVSKKPKNMRKDDWDLLCSMEFGLIIFSRPKSKGKLSMPQMLSGDLDGDFYFICWEDRITKQINHREGISERIKELMKKHRANKKKKKESSSLSNNTTDWFRNVQELMADTNTRNDYKKMVSSTYKLAETSNFNDKHALTFDAAYKQALDLHKHGGKVDLPTNVYEKEFPEHLHKYFTKHV